MFRLPGFGKLSWNCSGCWTKGQRNGTNTCRTITLLWRHSSIAHRLGGFELGVGGDVGVGIQRETRGVVPEHTADGFHVHAVLQGHGCEGVAQVMKADAWQPSPFQHSLQHVQDAVR